MTMIYKIFSTGPAMALGWTLLHSVWQALILWLTLIILLRIIPGKYSTIRYSLSAFTLLAVCVVNLLTFFALNASPHTGVGDSSSLVFHTAALTETASAATPVNSVLAGVRSAIPFMVGFWIVGTFIFTARILAGLWYVKKLKRSAVQVEDLWDQRIAQLSQQLRITRRISLGESPLVSVPLVIGYLKPVVLIPVGMFSGLSTEQIEAVFIHELYHIKRHDYLINIIQLVIEAFFFFNPFVWRISSLIRREREHCCDDAVLEHHGNAKAYAHALAYLEDKHLRKTGLALALTGNENQLLNRIKRIMERSVKNYSGREKIVPVLLLIVGLVCASWMTMQSRDKQEASEDHLSAAPEIPAPADTTIKKNEKSATYTRKKITTIGPDGEPREEIIENFEGDEELRDMMKNFGMDLDLNGMHSFDVPPIPDMNDFMQSFNMPLPGHFNFDMDSIPAPPMALGYDEDWERFADEFTKKFQENFGDFYEEHHKELEKMMEGMSENFQHRFNEDWAEQMRERAEQMQQHWLEQSEKMALKHDNLKDLGNRMEDLGSQMKDWEESHRDQLERMEEKMKSMEANMQEFEKALREELVEDGYLEKDEKIRNMQWDEDGTIEINGRNIKPSDEQKYRDLHKKYFNGSSGNFRYTE